MKLWIARNKSGSLLLFSHTPLNKYEHWLPMYDSTEVYVIDHKLFPEVTYENSPQDVELKLVSEIVGVTESPSKTFPRVNDFEIGASYRR